MATLAVDHVISIQSLYQFQGKSFFVSLHWFKTEQFTTTTIWCSIETSLGAILQTDVSDIRAI